MHRIVFVVVAPVYSFDLAIAQMVLDAAGGYELVVCAADPGRSRRSAAPTSSSTAISPRSGAPARAS
ncbi:hypothetical protein FXN61_40875 [Lentzea sp. PSKA42]|uniref:Uncharacterized protein n=1 Tax=Lentzea indica TaxID=2604800 RepID=A0ABX1FUN3_9PSEU|nr:hypothetical protein [Lentzea indica]NKE62740.1 hypothetical protein [Lentzea indica]